MVLCVPNCDCKWCMLTEMTKHSPYKETIEAMLADFSPAFVEIRDARRLARFAQLSSHVIQ